MLDARKIVRRENRNLCSMLGAGVWGLHCCKWSQAGQEGQRGEGIGVRSAGNEGLACCVTISGGLEVGGVKLLAFDVPVWGAAGAEWKQFLDGCE